jgi:penicillin-binding protein 1A
MDDSPYNDDDLAAFFASPDATAAPPQRRAEPAPPVLSDDDLELGAFFHSPDAAPSGDGATADAGFARTPPPLPSGPSAPPPPTGPVAIRRRKTRRALAVVLGLIGVGVLVGVGTVLWLSRNLPSLEQIENPRNLLATQVLTSDGVELARYYDGENRTWVSLDEMSEYVPAALIATEDRRFTEHWGVDAYAIGAIMKDFLTGRGARGASTITMQLARNLYRFEVGRERSIIRKAKEILTAIRIERTYTKPEILEAYLNTVPFLYNAYGIEAASQTYFSKPATDLNPSESATLIGMLAANTRYDPLRNPEASQTRRNVVLANMAQQGVIDQPTYEAARSAPIELAFDQYSHEDNIAPHFAEVLRLWFREWCERNGYDPYKDGLVIRTTIDSRMQALAADAVEEEMETLQGVVDRGWGSSANPFGYWWSRNRAVVDEYVRATERFTDLRAEGVGADVAVQQLRADEAFMDSLKSARTRLEAGLVAIDPTTGQVKAWVGGRDFVANKFDHVGQARRQPGSTFKLFAYTTAFNNGYSSQSTALDAPFSWGNWRPQNSGGGYAGNVTLADALRASRNVVAARITKHFGTAEIARTAYQMGIRSNLELTEFDADTCPPFSAQKNDCYPRSIALGTQDVSLLEMAAAYATVANYGVYHGPTLEEERPKDPSIPPHIVLAVERIEDRYGNVIEDFTPVAREVLNPSTAYTVFEAMLGVVRSGTGRGLSGYSATRNLEIAGKTGTTQENADGWFISMTPQLVVGSWTGFDDRRIKYPSTSVGQGGRTGLRNVGAFYQRLQTEGDSTIRLDPDVEFEKPANYQPPSRRGRIGGGSYLPPTDAERRMQRRRSSATRADDGGGGGGGETEDNRPARDLLQRFRERDRPADGGGSAPAPRPAPAPPPAEPRPQSSGSGSGGRIGW